MLLRNTTNRTICRTRRIPDFDELGFRGLIPKLDALGISFLDRSAKQGAIFDRKGSANPSALDMEMRRCVLFGIHHDSEALNSVNEGTGLDEKLLPVWPCPNTATRAKKKLERYLQILDGLSLFDTAF